MGGRKIHPAALQSQHNWAKTAVHLIQHEKGTPHTWMVSWERPMEYINIVLQRCSFCHGTKCFESKAKWAETERQPEDGRELHFHEKEVGKACFWGRKSCVTKWVSYTFTAVCQDPTDPSQGIKNSEIIFKKRSSSAISNFLCLSACGTSWRELINLLEFCVSCSY